MQDSPLNKFDAIHHIAIQVASISDSVNWYRGSFACEVLSQDTTHALLQFQNIKLTLILPSQEPNHLAFVREDANTLGELREKKEGLRSCFIADPSGNPVEIIETSSLSQKYPGESA